MAPDEWQAETLRRLTRLQYGGFRCGPGVRWWPVQDDGLKVAGPFESPAEFDAWLAEQERQQELAPISGRQTSPECHRHPGWACPGECQYVLAAGACAIEVSEKARRTRKVMR